jgi:hypothetical protein
LYSMFCTEPMRFKTYYDRTTGFLSVVHAEKNALID